MILLDSTSLDTIIQSKFTLSCEGHPMKIDDRQHWDLIIDGLCVLLYLLANAFGILSHHSFCPIAPLDRSWESGVGNVIGILFQGLFMHVGTTSAGILHWHPGGNPPGYHSE